MWDSVLAGMARSVLKEWASVLRGRGESPGGSKLVSAGRNVLDCPEGMS